jgi:signal transduction histidine kinase
MPLEEQVFVKALGGERTAREVLLRHRGTGEDVVVRSSAAPIRLGDRTVGAVAVHTDMSIRMREEAELRAALEFRDRMLGVLSHDLRNPLGVVLTSAGLLERQLSGNENAKPREAVRRIIKNAHTIERMVRDLLDYTRTRQGRGLPMVVRDVDLLQLCRQLIDGMQVLHPDRAVRVSGEGNLVAPVDPDRAAQVIANLMTNAINYSPADSTVDLALRDGGDSVVLEVTNHGAPIPADVLPRLFEAFQRGVSDHDRRSTGLGLGLYIAQQIVEAHGGSISVRSDETATVFTARWPRARA